MTAEPDFVRITRELAEMNLVSPTDAAFLEHVDNLNAKILSLTYRLEVMEELERQMEEPRA